MKRSISSTRRCGRMSTGTLRRPAPCRHRTSCCRAAEARASCRRRQTCQRHRQTRRCRSRWSRSCRPPSSRDCSRHRLERRTHSRRRAGRLCKMGTQRQRLRRLQCRQRNKTSRHSSQVFRRRRRPQPCSRSSWNRARSRKLGCRRRSRCRPNRPPHRWNAWRPWA